MTFSRIFDKNGHLEIGRQLDKTIGSNFYWISCTIACLKLLGTTAVLKLILIKVSILGPTISKVCLTNLDGITLQPKFANFNWPTTSAKG